MSNSYKELGMMRDPTLWELVPLSELIAGDVINDGDNCVVFLGVEKDVKHRSSMLGHCNCRTCFPLGRWITMYVFNVTQCKAYGRDVEQVSRWRRWTGR